MQEYTQLYQTLVIRPERIDDADSIINKIVSNKAQYKTAERATNVPWFVIAVIHSLEASLNFNSHLHNGDLLTGRTFHVPAGRIPSKNPPYTWPESAIDALEFDGVANWRDWSMALVASWEFWAKQKGFWNPPGTTKPMRGDICNL